MNSATQSARAEITSAAPIKSARAERRGLMERIGFLQARKSGHAQRRSQLLTIGNGKGKEKLFELLKGDESESGGCPGEA